MVGGLAKSLKFGDCVSDLGPHRFLPKTKESFDEVKRIMGDKLKPRRRISRIFLQNKFFYYPLKPFDVFFNLSPITSVRVILDYAIIRAVNAVSPKPDKSFEDWVVNRFGRTLYGIYFGPYTEKVWGIKPTQISPDWAMQRITLPNLLDVVKHTLIQYRDAPRTYASEFYYPTEGGVGSISEEFVKRLGENGHIYLNSEVNRLVAKDDSVERIYVRKENNEVWGEYDYVISTIPLPDLINAMRPRREIREAAKKLVFRSLIFVFLVLDRDRVSRDNWIYVPSQDIIFNRVSEAKNFEERNAPHGKTIICAEITCNVGDKVWKEKNDKIVNRVVDDFQYLKLFRKDEVLGSFVHRETHAYPVYDLEYKQNLNIVLEYVNSIENLQTIGRCGLFRYNNMDHSIGMGILTARDLGMKNKRAAYRIATEMEYFG